MREVILVHYGELALKGANRIWFENRVLANLERATEDLGSIRTKKLYGRFVVFADQGGPTLADIEDRLGLVFGISWFARAWMADMTWEDLLTATDALLPRDAPETSFGVKTKTADCNWPKGRTETNRDLGAFIVEHRGWRVDLTAPDRWVLVEVANGRVLVSCGRRPGAKGLPVGVGGRAMTFLSGGIDSPVAGWLMQSRGCRLEAIHFHSAPFTSAASQDKVRELAERLACFQASVELHMVPFAELQHEIVAATPQKYRIVLYRRFMLRIGEALASQRKCDALVTGESVGQVASQTLSNIRTIEGVGTRPILRPLIGLDKEAIIAFARKLGTFDISIQPYDDCCSFLMPRRPATRSTLGEIEEVERALDVERLVRETLARIELEVIRWTPGSK